jgi:hypothetical protein
MRYDDDGWHETVRIAELVQDCLDGVRALPEPTLGLKGGVNREAVLELIKKVAEMPYDPTTGEPWA